MPPVLLWLAALLIAISTIGVLFSRDWRWSLGMMAVQYLGAFVLTLAHWPLTMAAAKLLAGWMSIAVLVITRNDLPEQPASADQSWPQGRIFRSFATGLVFVAVAFSAPQVAGWFSHVETPIVTGSLILIGMGFLQLGIPSRPFYVITGLLTTFSGFEILYAGLENSILVAGFLALVTLALAFIGSYLLIISTMEEETA